MDQALAIQDGRARLKMSQEHLASAAGISARTVVRAESGFRVSGESLRNMCAVLGLDSSEIACAAEGKGSVGGLPDQQGEDLVDAVHDGAAGPSSRAPNGGPPEAIHHRAGAPVGAWQRLLAVGRTPIKEIPWRRAMGLRRTPFVAASCMAIAMLSMWAWAPVVNLVTVQGDAGRWIMEAPAARTTAAYLNALAAGKAPSRPPALSYFGCARVEPSNAPWRMVEALETQCGFTRFDILAETVTLADGTLQTIVGPVGREFGRDVARRLSGDPKVGWKVAFATGRQARALAWFDPREVPTHDMPRPPDSPSTWVYVAMSERGTR